jgi:hypothetical protein
MSNDDADALLRDLDLVQRRDEPGREGTLQHADQIKWGSGECNFTTEWFSLCAIASSYSTKL